MYTIIRKLPILTILLLLTLTAGAKGVEEGEARSLAEKVFGGRTPKLLNPGTKGDAPGYYIYNNPAGGFIVIASDDCASPVIAFSDKGSFDYENIHPNTAWWLSGMETLTKEAAASGKVAAPGVKEEWDSLRKGVIKGAGETKCLNTAEWGQSVYFDKYTPVIDGKRTPAGCVATSMSIVMKHHSFPPHGNGTTSAYQYPAGGVIRTVPKRVLGTEYLWSMLPQRFSSSSTEDQKDNVSCIMFEAGCAVQMQYTPDGSGAYTEDIPKALSSYFGFDKSVNFQYKRNHSDAEWLSMIKAEIDAGRPVIYGGDGGGEGHCFIADGYNGSNFIRFNWGWNGQNNGYYQVPRIYPMHDFTQNQGAVFNIKPDEGGKTVFTFALDKFVCNTRKFTPGEMFRIDGERLINYSSETFNGCFAPAVTDSDGNFKYLISSEVEAEAQSYYGFPTCYWNCILQETPSWGDKIGLFFSQDKSEWKQVLYNSEKGCAPIQLSSLLPETSFRFDASTRKGTVNTKAGAQCALLRGTTELTSRVSGSEGIFTIDFKDLNSGTYTIRLRLEGIEESFSIKL